MSALDFSEFSDKTVVITAAGTSLGANIAQVFAGYGARIAITDSNKRNLDNTVRTCSKILSKEQIFSFVGNMTKQGDAEKFIGHTMAKFGSMDVLVNADFVKSMKSFEATSFQDFQAIINGVLHPTFLVTKASLPHLLTSRGSIVNVGSALGKLGTPEASAFSAAMAALDSMTRSLSLEVARRGVRVNSVNPFHIEGTYDILEQFSSKEEYEEYYETNGKKATPIGKNCQVEDVVSAVLFLASEKSQFTTGAAMAIDGGYLNSVYEPKRG